MLDVHYNILMKIFPNNENKVSLRKLQNMLVKLEKWADLTGFKFSKSKCVHFCKKLINKAIYYFNHLLK